MVVAIAAIAAAAVQPWRTKLTLILILTRATVDRTMATNVRSFLRSVDGNGKSALHANDNAPCALEPDVEGARRRRRVMHRRPNAKRPLQRPRTVENERAQPRCTSSAATRTRSLMNAARPLQYTQDAEQRRKEADEETAARRAARPKRKMVRRKITQQQMLEVHHWRMSSFGP